LSWYIDSSAILKFVFDEQERPALLKILTDAPVTSEIARLEVKRTVSRINPEDLDLASEELAKVRIVDLSKSVLSTAEAFAANVTLGSLDAIHVATAIQLGSEIEGMITYDKQMAKNAYNLGIKVLSPGA
jgi:predicted nucleic acid-binding protein